MYTITGRNKLGLLEKYLSSQGKQKTILDIGGTKYDLEFIENQGFKNVTIANNSEAELEGCYKKKAKFDITTSHLNKKYDIILFLDVIEHLIDPDSAIENIKCMMKSSSVLIITTPNLACLFNRVFLLLGWSLPNYTPSKIKTGNPLMKAKVGSSFRNSFSHKSVFTYKQLKELMAAYGFKIIKTQGYHYGLMQGDEGGGNYGRIRSIVNSFSPTKLKEGIFLIVKKGGIEWF